MRYAISEPDYVLNPPEQPDDKCDSCKMDFDADDLIAGRCSSCVDSIFLWAAGVAFDVANRKTRSESDRMEAAEVLQYAAEITAVKVRNKTRQAVSATCLAINQ